MSSKLRILHTSDWHIGQYLHSFDRVYEHQCFLKWLLNQIKTLEIDALLIAGDIFDTANPSAVSQKLWLEFLANAKTIAPYLNIVVIAGNHDSPSRLEAPNPLLEKFGIHVVGLVCDAESRQINFEKVCVPLKNKNGEIKAWCLAVPFMRNNDLPAKETLNLANENSATSNSDLNSENLISTAANSDLNSENLISTNANSDQSNNAQALLYQKLFRDILERKEKNQAIVAMGHLHISNAQMSPDSERRIVSGGLDGLPSDIFDSRLSYVALGHLHLAQRVGGSENRRYSGSPIPMSFSEIHYKHQVIVFDLNNECVENLQQIEVPRFVQLLQIPAGQEKDKSIEHVLKILQELNLNCDVPEQWPYLMVRVHLNGPDPSLRAKIENALAGKPVRLTRIEVSTNTTLQPLGDSSQIQTITLDQLNPEEVFSKLFAARFGNPVPSDLMQAFLQLNHFYEEPSK